MTRFSVNGLPKPLVRLCWVAVCVQGGQLIDLAAPVPLDYRQSVQAQEAPAATPSLEQIEAKMIDGRQRIHSGHVSITAMTKKWDSQANAFRERTFQTECYFQGNSLRWDRPLSVSYMPPGQRPVSRAPPGKPRHKEPETEKHAVVVLSLHEGHWYWWQKPVSNPDDRYVLTAGDVDAILKSSDRSLDACKLLMGRMYDPRRLGISLHPSPSAAMRGEAVSFPGAAKQQVQITPSKYQDRDAWKIDFVADTARARVTYGVWVVPEWDWVIGRCQSDGHGISTETEYFYSSHTPSNVWFPARAVCQRRYYNALVDSEEITWQIKSLNEPVPADVFTPKGMGVPPGTRVQRIPINQGENIRLEWNGEDIVPISQPAEPEPEQPQKHERKWRWQIAVATVLGILGVALMAWGGRAIFRRFVHSNR